MRNKKTKSKNRVVIAEKVWRDKTKLNIPFGMQTDRANFSSTHPEIKNLTGSVDNLRCFTHSDMLSTKGAVRFDIYSSRKEIFTVKKENQYAPLYKPNYNYCKKRLDNLCIPFQKATSRPSPNQGIRMRNDIYTNVVQRSKIAKLANKKKQGFVDFSKYLAREKSPKSQLPCFMQEGGDSSRFSINKINEKSLRQTNFSNRDYYSKTDRKANEKSRRTKEKEDSLENSLSEMFAQYNL